MIESENAQTRTDLIAASDRLRNDLSTIASPTEWVRRYPLASAGAALAIGALLAPRPRRRDRQPDAPPKTPTQTPPAAAAPDAEESADDASKDDEYGAFDRIKDVARAELGLVRDLVKRYAVHTAVSTLTGVIAGKRASDSATDDPLDEAL